MSTSLAVDFVQFFCQQYPDSWAQLELEGFEPCSGATIGRIHGAMTLFVEIDPPKGVLLAWIWMPAQECFLGAKHEITGPLDAAMRQARHVLESLLVEDGNSGDVPRYAPAVVPTVRMLALLD